jgi:hypothetical protein
MYSRFRYGSYSDALHGDVSAGLEGHLSGLLSEKLGDEGRPKPVREAQTQREHRDAGDKQRALGE